MAGGLPPPPPGLDLTEDRSTVIVASTVATWILAVVTVALRVLSRRFKGNRLWIDDWLIIVSLVRSRLFLTHRQTGQCGKRKRLEIC